MVAYRLVDLVGRASAARGSPPERQDQGQPHRLHPRRLARAVHADLHGGRQILGKFLRGVVTSAQDCAGRLRSLVEVPRAREGTKAGQPGIAGKAGRFPFAVALGCRVRIARRTARAEALGNSGGRDRHLIVDGRIQRVELGGEVLQGRCEPLLLAAHREAVVDDEQHVRFGEHAHLVPLRDAHECHGLHRDGDVALAGAERDEQRD